MTLNRKCPVEKGYILRTGPGATFRHESRRKGLPIEAPPLTLPVVALVLLPTLILLALWKAPLRRGRLARRVSDTCRGRRRRGK